MAHEQIHVFHETGKKLGLYLIKHGLVETCSIVDREHVLIN